MVKTKKVSKKIAICLIIIILGAVLITSYFIKNKVTPSVPISDPLNDYTDSVVRLYLNDKVFDNIPLKTRNLDPETKALGFNTHNGVNPPYLFSKEARSELLAFSDSDLVPMKCMPEQIYLNHSGEKFSIVSPRGEYNGFIIQDKDLHSIINILNNSFSSDYVLSQFIACKTENNHFFVKYNPIQKGEEGDGFQTPNIVAYFAEIMPDGQLKELSYVTLGVNSFCRNPVQLTKSGKFYFACNAYRDNARIKPPYWSYLYRIDANNLTYKTISNCELVGISPACF